MQNNQKKKRKLTQAVLGCRQMLGGLRQHGRGSRRQASEWQPRKEHQQGKKKLCKEKKKHTVPGRRCRSGGTDKQWKIDFAFEHKEKSNLGQVTSACAAVSTFPHVDFDFSSKGRYAHCLPSAWVFFYLLCFFLLANVFSRYSAVLSWPLGPIVHAPAA